MSASDMDEDTHATPEIKQDGALENRDAATVSFGTSVPGTYIAGSSDAASSGGSGSDLTIALDEVGKLIAVLPSDLFEHAATLQSLKIGLASLLRCSTKEEVKQKIQDYVDEYNTNSSENLSIRPTVAGDIASCIMTVKTIGQNLGADLAEFAPVVYIVSNRVDWATISNSPGLFAATKYYDSLKQTCERFGLNIEELKQTYPGLFNRQDYPQASAVAIKNFSLESEDYPEFELASWNANSFYSLELPWINKELGMFVREEASRIWGELTRYEQASVTKLRINLEGPPGVGKTSTLLAWAFVQSRVKNVMIIIPVSRDSDYKVLYLSDNRIKASLSGLEEDDIRDCMVQLSNSLKVDIMIVDGATKANGKKIWRGMTTQAAKTAILCSSRQLMLKTDSDDPELTYFSWRWKDYAAALQCKEFATAALNEKWIIDVTSLESFDETPNLEDLVKAKYYYAGGSARFMFAFTVAKVKKEISTALQQSSPLISDECDRSDKAKNTLIQVISEGDTCRTCICSMYAAQQLVESNLSTLLSNLIFFQCNNPSTLGFVFEAQFITTMQKNKKITLSNVSPYIDGRVERIESFEIMFSAVKYIPAPSKANLTTAPLSTILIPSDWNNPCYDWAVVVDEDIDTDIALLTTMEKREAADQAQRDLQDTTHIGQRVKRFRLSATGASSTPVPDASSSANATSKVRSLYTFQATVAASHKVKTKYLEQLYEAFGSEYGITRVFHIFVVPHNNLEQFKIDSGALQYISNKAIRVSYFVGSTDWISASNLDMTQQFENLHLALPK